MTTYLSIFSNAVSSVASTVVSGVSSAASTVASSSSYAVDAISATASMATKIIFPPDPSVPMTLDFLNAEGVKATLSGFLSRCGVDTVLDCGFTQVHNALNMTGSICRAISDYCSYLGMNQWCVQNLNSTLVTKALDCVTSNCQPVCDAWWSNERTKIGLGLGLGIGIPFALICFFCILHECLKERDREGLVTTSNQAKGTSVSDPVRGNNQGGYYQAGMYP